MLLNDSCTRSTTTAKPTAYVATIDRRTRDSIRGSRTRRLSSSMAEAATTMESATGTQARKPGRVAVPAGKNAWKTAPQKAALASPPIRRAPLPSSARGPGARHSRQPRYAPRIARPRSVKATSGSWIVTPSSSVTRRDAAGRGSADPRSPPRDAWSERAGSLARCPESKGMRASLWRSADR
jgi:hypothetical protein